MYMCIMHLHDFIANIKLVFYPLVKHVNNSPLKMKKNDTEQKFNCVVMSLFVLENVAFITFLEAALFEIMKRFHINGNMGSLILHILMMIVPLTIVLYFMMSLYALNKTIGIETTQCVRLVVSEHWYMWLYFYQ